MGKDMNRLFECQNPRNGGGFLRVPDQTLVNAFLNPNDTNSGLPHGLLDGVAIAAGQIDSEVVGNIAVHPYITEIVLLLEGNLKIHMKDPGEPDGIYCVDMFLPVDLGGAGFTSAAAVIPPGTFFQLDNATGRVPARVLYISSPSYIFEPGEQNTDPPRYDDAVQLGRSWDALAEAGWNPPVLQDPRHSHEAREAALRRLGA